MRLALTLKLGPVNIDMLVCLMLRVSRPVAVTAAIAPDSWHSNFGTAELGFGAHPEQPRYTESQAR